MTTLLFTLNFASVFIILLMLRGIVKRERVFFKVLAKLHYDVKTRDLILLDQSKKLHSAKKLLGMLGKSGFSNESDDFLKQRESFNEEIKKMTLTPENMSVLSQLINR